jgi:hypothetical protein
MPVPPRVRILRLPLEHTDPIGTFADGQYLADSGRYQDSHYTVLHLFDDDGRHVHAEATVHPWEQAGNGCACERLPRATRPAEQLARAIEALPDGRAGDIAVQPFRVVVDGVLFGLVPEVDAALGDVAVLYPGGLVFTSPWLGDYECHHSRRAPA